MQPLNMKATSVPQARSIIVYKPQRRKSHVSDLMIGYHSVTRRKNTIHNYISFHGNRGNQASSFNKRNPVYLRWYKSAICWNQKEFSRQHAACMLWLKLCPCGIPCEDKILRRESDTFSGFFSLSRSKRAKHVACQACNLQISPLRWSQSSLAAS